MFRLEAANFRQKKTTGAQNFNFATKFLQSRDFLAQNFVFGGKIFGRVKI